MINLTAMIRSGMDIAFRGFMLRKAHADFAPHIRDFLVRIFCHFAAGSMSTSDENE